MIPEMIDHDLRYQFRIADRGDLFYVMLLDMQTLDAPPPTVPLWIRACGDEDSRGALMQWMAVRRGHWQDWGLLAQTAAPARWRSTSSA